MAGGGNVPAGIAASLDCCRGSGLRLRNGRQGGEHGFVTSVIGPMHPSGYIRLRVHAQWYMLQGMCSTHTLNLQMFYFNLLILFYSQINNAHGF